MRLLFLFFCISSACGERVEAVVQVPSASSSMEYTTQNVESLADLKKKLVDQKDVNADLSYKHTQLTLQLKDQEKVLLKAKRELRRTKARCKKNAEHNHHGHHGHGRIFGL